MACPWGRPTERLKFARCSKILSPCEITSALTMWLDWQILSVIAPYQNRLVASADRSLDSFVEPANQEMTILTGDLVIFLNLFKTLKNAIWANCQQKKRVFAPVDKYRKCCGLVLWSDWTRPRHNSMIDIRVVILGVPLLFREILKCLWYLFAKFRETWWLCINYLIQYALWRIKSFFSFISCQNIIFRILFRCLGSFQSHNLL